jgi:prepilin signal peptidase PulO-like enzyme (type II secretory pathway)
VATGRRRLRARTSMRIIYERAYSADPGGYRLGEGLKSLPHVPARDRLVRQRSRAVMAVATAPMPSLSRTDIREVSGRGVDRRSDVRSSCLAVWGDCHGSRAGLPRRDLRGARGNRPGASAASRRAGFAVADRRGAGNRYLCGSRGRVVDSGSCRSGRTHSGRVLLAMWFAYPKGLGFGDVKTGLLFGLVLGALSWQSLAVGAIAGPLLGAVGAIIAAIRHSGIKGVRLAYGPALIGGAWVGILAGDSIAQWYIDLTLGIGAS